MTLAVIRARMVRRLATLGWRLARPLTLGARGLLLDGETVLLVRHLCDGRWYLPGGGVEAGETPEEALRREAREEAGAEAGPVSLFGVYSNFVEGKSDHVVTFIADAASSQYRRNAETGAAAFFPLRALPDCTSPGTKRRVAEYLAGDWPRHGAW